MINHHAWVEDMTVKNQVKGAKEFVQRVLKPNHVPEGSKDDNIGKYYLFW